jgi:hypothetical protein
MNYIQYQYAINGNYISINVSDVTVEDNLTTENEQFGREKGVLKDIIDLPLSELRMNTSSEIVEFAQIDRELLTDQESQRAFADSEMQRTMISLITNNVNALNINKYVQATRTIQVPVYEIIQEPVLDENGDPVLDENGNPVVNNIKQPKLDENGNQVFETQNVSVNQQNEILNNNGELISFDEFFFFLASITGSQYFSPVRQTPTGDGTIDAGTRL